MNYLRRTTSDQTTLPSAANWNTSQGQHLRKANWKKEEAKEEAIQIKRRKSITTTIDKNPKYDSGTEGTSGKEGSTTRDRCRKLRKISTKEKHRPSSIKDLAPGKPRGERWIRTTNSATPGLHQNQTREKLCGQLRYRDVLISFFFKSFSFLNANVIPIFFL